MKKKARPAAGEAPEPWLMNLPLARACFKHLKLLNLNLKYASSLQKLNLKSLPLIIFVVNLNKFIKIILRDKIGEPAHNP